ncbi:MAG: sigma-70 family RNA polymerase sigma factor [Phycisphaeraceae bacterium]
MTQAPNHPISPLEQTRRRRRVTLANSARQLSLRDQATLRAILADRCDYIDHELFRRPGAEKQIFDDAPPISRPDTSWYHPVMETITEGIRLAANTSGTVLLTAAEERALFLQFNYCRYRVAKLRAQITGGPDAAVDPQLARSLLHWHRKAEAYRDQIANTNLALVLAMAKRTRLSDVDFPDLVSEGNMALLRAADKFDVARGFKFSTYACRAILKAFSRAGVKLGKYRQLFPTDFDPKLEKSDYMQRKREDHKDDCVDEIRQIINENRAALTDIEQSVIEHRFAVGHKKTKDPAAGPLTLEQVGRIIGVTKERVRQIQNKALDKIRQSLEDGFLG